MIGVLGPRFALTWVNEAKFVMKHTPDTGSIARLGGLKPTALQLSYGCFPDDNFE
jgi:hypothetical protein